MASVSETLDKMHARVRALTPADLRYIVLHLENEVKDPWKVLRLTIRLSTLCFIISLLLSHDLWFEDGRLYLPSPILPFLSGAPRVLNGLLYFGILGCSTLLFFVPQWRRLGIFMPLALTFFVLQDQLRGQFFLNMCAFNLLVAAVLPRELKDEHLDPLRYMAVGVYFWAGFYKINLFFMQFLFPWFVSPWFPYRGAAQVLGVVAPFTEALVGVCLLLPPTRWIGQFLACCMLLFVMASLGPEGHNRSFIVWEPNFYVDLLAVFLFLGCRRSLITARAIKNPLSSLAVALFILLPALGMTSYLGPHPSYKLYCACTPDVELEFGPHENLSFLPGYLAETMDGRRLNATQVTYKLFEVASPTFIPGDQPFLTGMKGFCPFLSQPREARLHVVNTRHFWSIETYDKVYDICTDNAKLLSGTD